MKHLLSGLAVAAIALTTSLSAAGSAKAESLAQAQPSQLYVGAGFFDISHSSEFASAAFDVGYIPDYNIIWEIRPVVGLMVNTDSAVFGHIGLSRSFYLTDNIVTRIQWGFGAYSQGNSIDLGQVFEFREQLEIGYEFDNGDMISAYVWHLSNADIADDNPGVNTAGIHYSFSF